MGSAAGENGKDPVSLEFTLSNIINSLYNMYTFDSANSLLGIYFIDMPRDVCRYPVPGHIIYKNREKTVNICI